MGHYQAPQHVGNREIDLRQALAELALSSRHKVRRFSRTIADLAGSENILPEHVNEAIHYRRLDRQL